MRTIQLTLANGDTWIFNPYTVESFGTISDKTYSYVDEKYRGMTAVVPLFCKDNESPYIVQESVEYIVDKLKENQ